ncbi:hypothetical protein GCM10011313_03820 [Mycetocola zhadangensis]|nr:hypothetical protein GCM10011313_03820 [Mycetocola zhadangensis]
MLAVLGVLATGIRPLALGIVAVAAVTEELVRVDVAEHRLPNRLVLPLYPVVLLSLIADGAISGSNPLVGIAAGAGWLLFLLVLCLAGGMGMGDVKLGGVLGLCLGGLSVVTSIGGLMLAFVAGAIGGVIVLLRRPASGGASRGALRVPFGPFLLAGFWLAVVCFPLLADATA